MLDVCSKSPGLNIELPVLKFVCNLAPFTANSNQYMLDMKLNTLFSYLKNKLLCYSHISVRSDAFREPNQESLYARSNNAYLTIAEQEQNKQKTSLEFPTFHRAALNDPPENKTKQNQRVSPFDSYRLTHSPAVAITTAESK